MNYQRKCHHALLIIFLLMVSAGSDYISAQKYQVHTYNENNGLAGSMVFDLVQDISGRMWFATRTGISVYDGVEWTSYTTRDGLPLNSFIHIAADSNGTIWALPDLGYFRIAYFENGRWLSLPSPAGGGDAGGFSAFEVFQSRSGPVLAVGTRLGGIFVFSGGVWHRITEAQGLLSNTINGLIESEGRIWAATDKGISLIGLDDLQVNNRVMMDFSFPTKKILSLAPEMREENRARIWLAGETWIGYLENSELVIERDDVRPVRTAPFFLLQMCPDRKGGLFFGNIYQVQHFNKVSGMLEDLGRESGLITEGMTSLMIDYEYNIWIGSLRGVSKIVSMRFSHYNSDHGLLMDEVSAAAEIRPGLLAFGHNNGITFFKRDGVSARILSPDRSQHDTQTRVLEMTTDRASNLWFAAAELGLGRIDPEGRLTWYRTEQGFNPPAKSVACDESGSIWAINDDGLFIFDGANFTNSNKGKIVPNTRRIQKSLSGGIFISTYSDGFYKLKDGEFHHVLAVPDASINVYSVLEDSRGNVWVATINGLCRVEGDVYVPFRSGDFEIKRPVYLIVEDFSKNLWFGTDNGVIRWDGNTAKPYTIKEGFGGQETNRGAGLVDSSGDVWIGTDLGISRYMEEFDYGRDDIPGPLIELRYLDFGGVEFPLNLPVVLPANPKNLIFHFRGISFIDENEVRYRCRLEGYDEDWLPEFKAPGNQIRYTSIPAGRYRFYVQAVNVLGRWSDIAASVDIIVRKAIWNQWWFYLLLLLVVSFFSLSIQKMISGRKYAVRLEGEVEERTGQIQQSLREKEVMLREIHHRVKNNMQIVSSLLRLQASSIQDPDIRKLFEISQNRIWTMALIHEKLYRAEDFSRIDFHDYLKSLTKNLFSMYAEESQDIELLIEAKEIYLNITHAIPCALIVNELISNAMKHAFSSQKRLEIREAEPGDGETCDGGKSGPAAGEEKSLRGGEAAEVSGCSRGFISIIMERLDDEKIELIISDNGVGFPSDVDFENTRSLGMQLVVELVRQLDGSIELDRGKGTRFRIVF